MPLVYNLNLPHAQKVGLFFVFSIASVVCIASIGRLVVLAKTFSGPAQKDFSYNIKDAMIWSIAEIHVGVIAVSLPTLKPLLKKTMPSVFGYDSNSNSYGKNPSGYSSNGMKSGMGNSKNRSQLGKSIPLQVHSRKIDHPLDAAYSSSTEELQPVPSGEAKAVVSVV